MNEDRDEHNDGDGDKDKNVSSCIKTYIYYFLCSN